MPVVKEDFEGEKFNSKVEDDVFSFLNERKEEAFTSQEIMAGVHVHTDFDTPETTKVSTFTIADFTSIIHDLVRKGKVKRNVVGGRMYFMVTGDSAKCPKCGNEAVKPKKTWKMAGRPDKNGKRLQLKIGLFECPNHGTFRSVLEKQKI